MSRKHNRFNNDNKPFEREPQGMNPFGNESFEKDSFDKEEQHMPEDYFLDDEDNDEKADFQMEHISVDDGIGKEYAFNLNEVHEKENDSVSTKQTKDCEVVVYVPHQKFAIVHFDKENNIRLDGINEKPGKMIEVEYEGKVGQVGFSATVKK